MRHCTFLLESNGCSDILICTAVYFVADSVSIPEGEVTATGARAAILRSSIHSGAAGSLSVFENSSVSLAPCTGEFLIVLTCAQMLQLSW